MTETQGGVRWEAGGDQHRSCLASPIMGGGDMFGLEVIPKEIFCGGGSVSKYAVLPLHPNRGFAP